MFDMIDVVLTALYTLAVGSATYIIWSHRKYFQERFRKGVVSAFMLAMLFFLIAYDIKMLTAVWIRSSVVFGYHTELIGDIQRIVWMFAQIGTTTGIVILAILTYTRRYDLWFYLKKIERKDDGK